MAAFSVRGEVTPVIISLSQASPSYTVSATNILLIEHGYAGENTGITPFLIFSNGLSVSGVRVEPWTKMLTHLQPSLKVPSGWVMSVIFSSTNTDQVVTLFGLLVSPQDLYAGVPSSFENVARVGGQLSGRLALEKPHPVRIRVESSPDLKTWARETNAVVAGPSVADEFQITVPADSVLAEFYRAETRLRRGQGGL